MSMLIAQITDPHARRIGPMQGPCFSA